MVEFVISAKEFKKNIRMILSGRAKHLDTDSADFRAVANSLDLSSVGTETQMDAEVIQAGRARVPLVVLKTLKKAAVTFKQDKLEIQIEDGRVKLQSYGLSHSGIHLLEIESRVADIPVDASLLDTLAVVKLFSGKELSDSGLLPRVHEARLAAVAAIDHATTCLSKFEIPREAIQQLLEDHIGERSAALKANFREFGAGGLP